MNLSGKQINDWLERAGYLTRLTQKNEWLFEKRLMGYIREVFHVDSVEDLDVDEKKMVELSAKRADKQLQIFLLDEERNKLENQLKKLKTEPDKPKTRDQIKIETQFGMIMETETQMKKALQIFVVNMPDWYNQRISERTRVQFEQRNNRKPGFEDKIKNQDLVIIEDFGMNDLQYIFGRDVPNQDLVKENVHNIP